MLTEDTQKRIKAIKQKIEEVGDTFGIPHDQAVALVIVDAVEQNTIRPTSQGKLWAWFKALLAHGSETAKKIHID